VQSSVKMAYQSFYRYDGPHTTSMQADISVRISTEISKLTQQASSYRLASSSMSILFGIISRRLVVEANGCWGWTGVTGDGGEDEQGDPGGVMDDGKKSLDLWQCNLIYRGNHLHPAGCGTRSRHWRTDTPEYGLATRNRDLHSKFERFLNESNVLRVICIQTTSNRPELMIPL
jgi:hypothetical protein